jgi:hypothetical protein
MGFTKVDISSIKNNSRTILFDSYFDYVDYINDLVPNLRGNARTVYDSLFDESYLTQRARRNENWYGTTDFNEVKQDINTFKFNDELKRELEAFDRNNTNIEQIDLEQKKKITFTAQEIGIFSFDLASLGLIPVVEYFSPLLNRIVGGDEVRSYKTGNGDVVFYHIFVAEIPQHYLEQKNGKLFSPILNIFINQNSPYVIKEIIDGKFEFIHLKVAEIPRHDVQQRQVIGDNGLPKFSSTWKKSFIYIPQIPFQLPQIDIVIQVSYNANVQARDEMFWTSVAVNAIIEKLSKSNVRFRIYGGGATSWGRNETKVVSSFIKLKDLNDPLNANTTAIISADARNFRYQFFKYIITASYDLGYDSDINTGLGSAINDADITKRSLIKALETSKDFGSSKDDSLNANTKIIINSCLSQQQAQDTFDRAIRQIKNLEQTTP